MGFKKTSEGRVFFKSPDNDDAPATKTVAKSTTNAKPKTKPKAKRDDYPEPAKKPAAKGLGDTTQMQILMLLKSLNTKMKETREDRTGIKRELDGYKTTIKRLEKQTKEQENNYIDLEQKVATKQTEAGKKTARVENTVKDTLEKLDAAKNLVKELEAKSNVQDKEFIAIKDDLKAQHKKEAALLKKQETIEATQKEQGEKMVDTVATYVAITKRVSEAEARTDALDNKIDDASSQYLKLDRKMDKFIEDRSRMLRKVERIEQAVLETRDALNAKAMVLLTNQGAVAGIDMPNITDAGAQADPMALSRRLEEEAMMPWWRKPTRLQPTSLGVILLLVLLLGWLMSSFFTSDEKTMAPALTAPSVNLSALEPTYGDSDVQQAYEDMGRANAAPSYIETGATTVADAASVAIAPVVQSSILEDVAPKEVIDVQNEEQMLRIFEKDPNSVAQALNNIEPSDEPSKPIKTAALTQPETITPPPAPVVTTKPKTKSVNLRNKINADKNLTDIAKKIEEQAFAGVPEAQHDMGAIYVAGHGSIKKDLSRAVFWFTEAANNGVANAQYNLGVLYHQGLGVDKSLETAMHLYNDAANSGHPEAQYNLGIANIEGIGVPYNPGRAARFFESAANKGITEAAYNLGLIYENGLLGQTRPDEALTWYKYAADAGSPEAKSALEQLASSLSIDLADVNRIVENVKIQKGITNVASNNSQKQLVSQIQEQLVRRGLYPGPVDGMIGPNTTNAIKTFQRTASLQQTGTPSQSLLDYLMASN